MGRSSVEISKLPGSVLSANQQTNHTALVEAAFLKTGRARPRPAAGERRLCMRSAPAARDPVGNPLDRRRRAVRVALRGRRPGPTSSLAWGAMGSPRGSRRARSGHALRQASSSSVLAGRRVPVRHAREL